MNLRDKYLRTVVKYNSWKQNRMFVKSAANATHELAYNIVKRCISDSNANLLLAPISNVYYIQTKDLNIKILDNYVQIINGKYFYHINLPELLMRDLEHRFRFKIERRSHTIENTIANNTNSSLRNIFNSISHEKTTSAPPLKF